MVVQCFALKDNLLVVDSALARNHETVDILRKPQSPISTPTSVRSPNTEKKVCSKVISVSVTIVTRYRLLYQKDASAYPQELSPTESDIDVSQSNWGRERRLALVYLWREAVDKNLPSQIEITMELSDLKQERTVFQLEGEARALPELLRYLDVNRFGRQLWHFCVDQLSTKDRAPLWNILGFLGAELPTPMALRLLQQRRNALVRFHVSSLDKVCLKIISSSTFPIATALYLAAFMRQNARRDSSRQDQFDEMYRKYSKIATDLLSQIESDHLVAILIEIPSNIDDLSILDIIIEFNLEEILEFHRLKPIFLNLWSEYRYLDPSNSFRYLTVYHNGVSNNNLHPYPFVETEIGRSTL